MHLHVDLGSEIGAAFGTLNLGESFDVEVRVQGSSSYDVTAFQVVLTFDSSVIRVLSDTACVQGSDWSSSFECTTNDPVNEVQVIGSCGLSPSSGCGSKGRLAVATITFTTIAAGVTEITGDIIKIKDDNTMTQDLPIFAGADTLVVSDGGRRSLLGPSPVIHTAIRDTAVTHRRSADQRRRLLVSTDCDDMLVLGDTNGDCAFDVEDVQFLQYYISGSIDESTLSARQVQAMDPDMDGDEDGVDIDYLMKVLANKYRFLTSFNWTQVPFSISSTVRTSSSELASSTQTSVLYEIGTTMNDAASMTFGIGRDLADTADGVVVTAEVNRSGSLPGIFVVEADRVVYSEPSVGVVVLIRTMDANGATSDSRQFSFY